MSPTGVAEAVGDRNSSMSPKAVTGSFVHRNPVWVFVSNPGRKIEIEWTLACGLFGGVATLYVSGHCLFDFDAVSSACRPWTDEPSDWMGDSRN